MDNEESNEEQQIPPRLTPNRRGLQDIKNQFQVAEVAHDFMRVDPEEDAVVPDAAFISTGLLNYIKSETEGKAILKQYNNCLQKNMPLSKSMRDRLTRLVIAREKDYALENVTLEEQIEKFIITKNRFETLANEIAHIFKYESAATYFMSHKQVVRGSQSVKILASGKLWNHYNYTKTRLRDDQILRGKSRGRLCNILSEEELEPAIHGK